MEAKLALFLGGNTQIHRFEGRATMEQWRLLASPKRKNLLHGIVALVSKLLCWDGGRQTVDTGRRPAHSCRRVGEETPTSFRRARNGHTRPQGS